MTGGATSAYWRYAAAALPRVLSWQDTESFSLTYGCFDRTYWCWKFTDFAGARFQEAVYSLAHVLTAEVRGLAPESHFLGNARVAERVEAGLRYWQRLQYSDGSFDEAYPFEHSLAATAFTLFYIGEAILRLGDSENPEARRVADTPGLRSTVARAAEWLCRHDEHHGVLSNHLAAAAAALHAAYRLCGEQRFLDRCEYFLDRIYRRQSSEGWYEEYGGADPGYQTHGTFYLARVWEHTQDPRLLMSLDAACVFLRAFLHPNGTLGGEYGSRNTTFYFPAGFEILSRVSAAAAQIAGFMRPFVEEQAHTGLAAMDAYNQLPMLNNYLFAAEAAARGSSSQETPVPLPCQAEGEWRFPEAGLVVRSTRSYYAVLGLSKGGTVKVFNKATGSLALSDSGCWTRLGAGTVVSSQSLNPALPWSETGGTWTADFPFTGVTQRVLSPLTLVAFRLVSLTLGRLGPAAALLKRLLVHVLIRRRPGAPVRMRRSISLGEDRVQVSDAVTVDTRAGATELRWEPRFATVHMGSSRYFQPDELQLPGPEGTDVAAVPAAGGTIQRTRTWTRQPDQQMGPAEPAEPA